MLGEVRSNLASSVIPRCAEYIGFDQQAVAGTSVGALLRFSGLGLIPTPTAVDAALVWVRTVSWAFVIGAVALQVVPLLRGGVRGGAVRRSSSTSSALSPQAVITSPHTSRSSSRIRAAR